jgi:hypothetical protein
MSAASNRHRGNDEGERPGQTGGKQDFKDKQSYSGGSQRRAPSR